MEKLCAECRSGPDDVCQIANILFPNGFSCAGSKAAIEKLLEKANGTEGCLQLRHAVNASLVFGDLAKIVTYSYRDYVRTFVIVCILHSSTTAVQLCAAKDDAQT